MPDILPTWTALGHTLGFVQSLRSEIGWLASTRFGAGLEATSPEPVGSKEELEIFEEEEEVKEEKNVGKVAKEYLVQES